MLRVEIRDDPGALDELAGWWDTQTGPTQSVFLRTEWFRALAGNVLAPDDTLQILVVRDGEDPVATLPMYRSGRKLRSLTELSTEAFDLVHDGDSRGVELLVAELNRSIYVRIEALLGDSPLVATVDRFRGWYADRRTESAYIDLRPGLDQLRSSLGKSMRSNLNRGERALEELGDLRMEPHPSTHRVDQVLADGLALEAAGWKGAAGVAVANSARRLAFFTDLAKTAEAENWLRLGALYLDDRMIAFNYDLEYAGRIVGILTAYDEELPRRCSPGQVLLWKTLEKAAPRGVEAYELGGAGGRNAWKMQWTDKTTPRYYLVGFGTNPRGRVAHFAWRSRDWLRNSGRRKPPRAVVGA
ncbi:MAG TPA: GNAT family N-acetyltransferase [Acidimicrobiia bacterium]|nr:GNAT family N-acetyltransferase [Acidimicrobiia bacterium]